MTRLTTTVAFVKDQLSVNTTPVVILTFHCLSRKIWCVLFALYTRFLNKLSEKLASARCLLNGATDKKRKLFRKRYHHQICHDQFTFFDQVNLSYDLLFRKFIPSFVNLEKGRKIPILRKS